MGLSFCWYLGLRGEEIAIESKLNVTGILGVDGGEKTAIEWESKVGGGGTVGRSMVREGRRWEGNILCERGVAARKLVQQEKKKQRAIVLNLDQVTHVLASSCLSFTADKPRDCFMMTGRGSGKDRPRYLASWWGWL
jgi:hypothetical protein